MPRHTHWSIEETYRYFCEERPLPCDDPVPIRIELHVSRNILDELGFPRTPTTTTATTINHSLLLSADTARAKAKLSPILSGVGIPTNFHAPLIDDISSHSWNLSSIERCPIHRLPKVPAIVVHIPVDELEANGVEEIGGELMFVDAFVTVPATVSSIEALEKVVVLDDGGGGGGVSGLMDQCAICFEELVGGSEASRMPCSHVYHGDCIVRWLRTSHFCPVCRYKMPAIFDCLI
ncbi:E3 ubiquitin-protein ligase RING1-like [Rhododendron vialii]|uniref:E3 ubiquitin-protein ligase RING1-like n=1 Tax=Rhododendron vialii TaxID=182163 RepID=UPI00265ED70A|nr:E3 ubiquitin-protein ligase RING1-like [Rhododendron vialii]